MSAGGKCEPANSQVPANNMRVDEVDDDSDHAGQDLKKKKKVADSSLLDESVTTIDFDTIDDQSSTKSALLAHPSTDVKINANENEKTNEREAEERAHEECAWFAKMFKSRGYVLALFSAFLHSLSKVLLKHSKFLVGSEHSFIRYALQLLVLLLVIRYMKLGYLGPKKSRFLLSLRGIIGALGMVCIHFSITFIDPSDTVALTHSSIIITAVLARIFLKEKLTMAHLIALVLTINGVLFISQPSFLFKSEDTGHHQPPSHHHNHHQQQHQPQQPQIHGLNFTHHSSLNNTSGISHHDADVYSTIIKSARFYTLVGIFFGICGAFSSGSNHTMIKKLCIEKVHFSITTIYSAYFGVPFSFAISLILFLTGQSHRNISVDAHVEPYSLVIQILYSVISSLLGLVAQISLNLALMYDDATRISILRTADLFFTFVLQYFFLSIEKNLYDMFGACSILMGSLSIFAYRFAEKILRRHELDTLTKAGTAVEAPSKVSKLLKNIFLFKF